MRKLRELHSAEFKAQVALSAIKNEKTLHELAAHDEVHPNHIREGNMKALAAIPDALSGRRLKDEALNGDLLTNLYEQIGRQKVELEWRNKKLGPWTSGAAGDARTWPSGAVGETAVRPAGHRPIRALLRAGGTQR